jgi:hypothetical protein
MPIPSVGALPVAPNRADAPALFSTRADAHVAALTPWTADVNALASYLNLTTIPAINLSESNAAASAAAALASKNAAAVSEANAANSAISAINSAGTQATSVTSLAVGAGSKSFTLAQTGKAFVVGQFVAITRTSSPTDTAMAGAITAFTAGTGAITVNVTDSIGTGTFTDWTITQTSIPSLFRSPSNYIVDGRLDSWLEGTSQTTSGYGSATMVSSLHSGYTKTTSRQPLTFGGIAPQSARYFKRTILAGAGSATDYARDVLKIEGVGALSGKTFTFSFWAAASGGATKVAINFERNFGTGGSPSTVDTSSTQIINLTSTLTRYTVTASFGDLTGKTLGTNNNDHCLVNIWFAAGSSVNAAVGHQAGTIDWTCAQINDGTQALAFEEVAYQEADIRIRRYYEKSTVGLNSYAPASSINLGYRFGFLQKRGVPSYSISSISVVNVATPFVSAIASDSTAIVATSLAIGVVFFSVDVTLDARL